MYALNPVNTDAARHFCTSVREIFTEILDRWADDKAVVAATLTAKRHKAVRRGVGLRFVSC
ncbi:hypothetical protein [Tianweitania sp.]|uniref:pPIWI-associating nuclease domain-containing protein n=1 Tax=Tianweitania sp. TaxID=2021634 RepID=UPI00289ABE7A|nr:hypothetical protein [Tianweitania sp.]